MLLLALRRATGHKINSRRLDKMKIRILNKKTDMEEINEWLPYALETKELPGHTFCAVVDGDIVAIAGLRLMEGEVCFIDSMATNQAVKGEIRNEALDKLTVEILTMAKNLGFKKIFATTKEACIVNRAEKHGFVLSDQKVIMKEL